jgi:hypothetical protein
LSDYKNDALLKAIYFNLAMIETSLHSVNFFDQNLRDELIEIKEDVKDMRADFSKMSENIQRRFDIIDRITDDHLHHLSTLEPEKVRKFRIVK